MNCVLPGAANTPFTMKVLGTKDKVGGAGVVWAGGLGKGFGGGRQGWRGLRPQHQPCPAITARRQLLGMLLETALSTTLASQFWLGAMGAQSSPSCTRPAHSSSPCHAMPRPATSPDTARQGPWPVLPPNTKSPQVQYILERIPLRRLAEPEDFVGECASPHGGQTWETLRKEVRLCEAAGWGGRGGTPALPGWPCRMASWRRAPAHWASRPADMYLSLSQLFPLVLAGKGCR